MDLKPDGVLILSADEWLELVKEGSKVPLIFKVNGTSMEPLIRYQKDTVTVMPLEREPVKGDIVLFKKPTGETTLHRVYKIKGNFVQMLGDNCDNPDAVVPISNIYGIAVKMEKNGKTVVLDNDSARFKGKIRMALFPIRRRFRITGYKVSSVAKRILKGKQS